MPRRDRYNSTFMSSPTSEPSFSQNGLLRLNPGQQQPVSYASTYSLGSKAELSTSIFRTSSNVLFLSDFSAPSWMICFCFDVEVWGSYRCKRRTWGFAGEPDMVAIESVSVVNKTKKKKKKKNPLSMLLLFGRSSVCVIRYAGRPTRYGMVCLWLADERSSFLQPNESFRRARSALIDDPCTVVLQLHLKSLKVTLRSGTAKTRDILYPLPIFQLL